MSAETCRFVHMDTQRPITTVVAPVLKAMLLAVTGNIAPAAHCQVFFCRLMTHFLHCDILVVPLLEFRYCIVTRQLPRAIHVSVVVSLVCRALLIPFIDYEQRVSHILFTNCWGSFFLPSLPSFFLTPPPPSSFLSSSSASSRRDFLLQSISAGW